MKGIAHFAAGVAFASCFPEAVRAGADGQPLYFLLGGICGLLPDTIDFRVVRFFHRHDIEVAPDPNRPDAQMIADAVALAVHQAHLERKPVTIRLNTIRLAADRWQSYTVRFDVPGRRVAVTYGPAVDTGGRPAGDGAAERLPEGAAPLACGVRIDYEAATTVDIFDGPVFRMTPTADGRVTPLFIPWHRVWSHSVVSVAAAALVGTALWNPLAGLVAGGALGLHALMDQLGFLGGSLLHPFRRDRVPGLRRMHSGETLPNAMTVWLSGLLTFWNLYGGHGGLPPLHPLPYVVYGALAPLAAALLLRRAMFRPAPPAKGG